MKVVRNVDPSAQDLNIPGSWTVRKESDGSTSIITLGQKIVDEVTTEYRSKSKISLPQGRSFNGTDEYVTFETQPTGRYYVLKGMLTWSSSELADAMPLAGFRVLASEQEWTDIYYDPKNEELIIERTNSSLISSCRPLHCFPGWFSH